MRISPAKFLILFALILVIVVELRTVLAFVDIELTVLESVAIGIVAIFALIVWTFAPLTTDSDE